MLTCEILVKKDFRLRIRFERLTDQYCINTYIHFEVLGRCRSSCCLLQSIWIICQVVFWSVIWVEVPMSLRVRWVVENRDIIAHYQPMGEICDSHSLEVGLYIEINGSVVWFDLVNVFYPNDKNKKYLVKRFECLCYLYVDYFITFD